MANRIAVFADITNQFYCINKKWPKQKLNYTLFMEEVSKYGEVVRAYAYGTQENKAAKEFIKFLFHLGFETHYKNTSEEKWHTWTPGMVVNMVQMIDRIDIAIISTSDKTVLPAIEYLKNSGVKTIVIACGIKREIRQACDLWIEISEEMLNNIDLKKEN